MRCSPSSTYVCRKGCIALYESNPFHSEPCCSIACVLCPRYPNWPGQVMSLDFVLLSKEQRERQVGWHAPMLGGRACCRAAPLPNLQDRSGPEEQEGRLGPRFVLRGRQVGPVLPIACLGQTYGPPWFPLHLPAATTGSGPVTCSTLGTTRRSLHRRMERCPRPAARHKSCGTSFSAAWRRPGSSLTGEGASSPPPNMTPWTLRMRW